MIRMSGAITRYNVGATGLVVFHHRLALLIRRRRFLMIATCGRKILDEISLNILDSHRLTVHRLTAHRLTIQRLDHSSRLVLIGTNPHRIQTRVYHHLSLSVAYLIRVHLILERVILERVSLAIFRRAIMTVTCLIPVANQPQNHGKPMPVLHHLPNAHNLVEGPAILLMALLTVALSRVFLERQRRPMETNLMETHPHTHIPTNPLMGAHLGPKPVLSHIDRPSLETPFLSLHHQMSL